MPYSSLPVSSPTPRSWVFQLVAWLLWPIMFLPRCFGRLLQWLKLDPLLLVRREWERTELFPEEEEAFKKFCHTITWSMARFCGMVYVGMHLILLPTDVWVFAERPEVIPLFRMWRIGTILILGTFLIMLSYLRHRPTLTATIIRAGIPAAALSGALVFAPHTSLDDPWFFGNMGVAGGTIVFMVPGKERLRLMVIAFLASVGMFLFLNPQNIRHPYASALVIFFMMIFAMFFLAGHLIFILLRGFFHQQAVSRRRAEDLSVLSQHLEERLNQQSLDFYHLLMEHQSAREEERLRISRELHDELGQLLTAIRAEVASLERVSSTSEQIIQTVRSMENLVASREEDEHESSELLDQVLDRVLDLEEETRRLAKGDVVRRTGAQRISEIAGKVDVAMRRIIHDLRPQVLDDLGLHATLEWFMASFEERTGVRVRWEVVPKDLDLPLECLTHVYRIVQEGMTNIERHAQAQEADVSVRILQGMLRVSISDNGRGIDQVEVPGRFGLRGLGERVRLLNGCLQIHSSPGAGTALIADIPLSALTEVKRVRERVS